MSVFHFSDSADKPKPTLEQRPDFDKLFTGQSVAFTCRVDMLSDWEYLLYHNENELPTTDGVYSISALDASKAGSYHCRAKRGAGPFYTEKSETKTLQVSGKLPHDLSQPFTTSFTSSYMYEAVLMTSMGAYFQTHLGQS